MVARKVFICLVALMIAVSAAPTQEDCPTQLCRPLAAWIDKKANKYFKALLDASSITVDDIDKLGTIFVPTNKAIQGFAANLGYTITELVASVPQSVLDAYLLFHVAPGQYRPNAALDTRALILPTAIATNELSFDEVCADANGDNDLFLKASIAAEGTTVTGGLVKATVLNTVKLCGGILARKIDAVLDPCVPAEAMDAVVIVPLVADGPMA